MKKHFNWFAMIFIIASMIFMGCSSEVETQSGNNTSDKTAPADVTELTATNKDASVLLTWTDATDEDIYGYEVTWNNNAPINRSAAMELNSMMVAPGAKGCYISNLTNGTEYAFTVKSVDTSGNKSAGVTKTITKKNTPTIIVDAKKDIFLVPSTTEKTNQDVTVKVEINSEIAESVEKILYSDGLVMAALSGTDITESKEFVVPENKSYSVVIKYTDGTVEFFFIDINNIDKTAPKPVSDVNIPYSKETGKITLSWTNPADEDFAGTEIVYGKTGSKETKTLTFDKDTTLATIENIPADDSEYTIVIKTKDDLGNLSEAKTVTVVAATGATITSVNLDRTHLDTIMTNRDIEVTISGSNFDLITSLWVQVFDGSSSVELNKNVSIDAANNTATATVTAPVPKSPTNNGTTYTVKVIVNSTQAGTTASFVVSNPADVTNITFAQTQIPVGTQEKVTATITGTNFDIRGETQVKLFDANYVEYTESTVTVPLESNNSNTEFTVDIPLPTTEGIYTVAVFFDDVKESTTTLQVCGTPIISEVTIPVAGTNYGGNVLPLTIIGKNFTAPGATASGFTISDPRFKNVTIVSDTKATAEITCPYAVETTNVTVSYGDSSAKTTLKVIESVNSYEVGDIILTDGSKVSVANVATYTIDENNKPIGVVAMITDVYRVPTPKVIGLQESASSLKWAPKDTTGYNTKFTNIVCTPSTTGSGAVSRATFTGDTDGSDNWAEICTVDPEGTKDAATNYPIFNFANTYGTTVGLTGTGYESGWYVPSIAELCEVYKNKEVIQTSLTKANGFNFGTSAYWSSSQNASHYILAYLVYYDEGYMNLSDDFNKNTETGVFVLQALTAK